MKLDTGLAGTSLKDYTTNITWRRTMNYAAAVKDHNPAYFDDEREGGIVAPPMFAVAVTWPVSERLWEYVESERLPKEVFATQVHYTEHLVFHRSVRAGDRLTIKGSLAAVRPVLMRGYYNNPEATEKVIDPDGWYYTSDMAFKDADGYIHLTGRASEMYKSGGENVYPREIEEVIESHSSVLFAAVIPVPDEVYQEVGWAYAMLQPGKDVSEEELRAWCKSKLSNFKVPKRFFVRQALPLLPTGKVDKVVLRKEALESQT
ncbi:MAG: MaoC family dehydratase N-terminal domain-containing protein [Thermodesulfobacteriota bacterium]